MKGASAMIERFIEDYAEKAYQAAYHLCGNAEEAKELVQEAFVKLIRSWERYDAEQPLENWYLTILRNIYFDGLKRHERRYSISLDAPVPGLARAESFAECLKDGNELPLLERLERLEDAHLVQRALVALSAEHRAILTMVELQGLDYDKVAAVMDCPLGTVRSRLSRARAALKRVLLAQNAEVVER